MVASRTTSATARARNSSNARSSPTASPPTRPGASSCPGGGSSAWCSEPLHARSRLAEALARIERGRFARRVNLVSGAVEAARYRPDTCGGVRRHPAHRRLRPRWRMLIVGAGQLRLSRPVRALQARLPRHAQRTTRRVSRQLDAAGVEITTEMPDDAVAAMRPDRRSVIPRRPRPQTRRRPHRRAAHRRLLYRRGGLGATSAAAASACAYSFRSRRRPDRPPARAGRPAAGRRISPPEIALAIVADPHRAPQTARA